MNGKMALPLKSEGLVYKKPIFYLKLTILSTICYKIAYLSILRLSGFST
jgi:hypothetical protein